MNRKWISSIFLPVLGMIFILTFAYGGAALNKALEFYGTRDFDVNIITTALWTNALITFLSIGAAILLFWEIMTRIVQPKWVGWIFLIVGLFSNLLPIIPRLFFVLNHIQEVDWGFLPTLLTDPAPNSPLPIVEATVAVVGLLILILPKSKSIERD